MSQENETKMDDSPPLDTAGLAERYESASKIVDGFAYSLRIRKNGPITLEWCTETKLLKNAYPENEGDEFPGFFHDIHPDDEASLLRHFHILSTGKTDDRDFRFRSSDESYVWLKIRATPYPETNQDGSVLVFGIAEDETERTSARLELEADAELRERELASLLEISHNMASTLELEPLLRLILTELEKLVDYTGAAILKPDGDDLVMLEYRGPMPRDQTLRLRVPIARSQGYQKIINERVPVIISDILEDTPGTSGFQRSVRQFRPFFGYAYSVLLTPLIVKDRLIGVLRLDHRKRGHFIDRHATLALAVANQAAVAMENAQLYESAQQLAKLEERHRIARELHDSISQSLYGIRLGAQTAIELQGKDPGKTAESLNYVRDLADAGLKEMRALLYELRPEAIASEGLISGLNKLTDSLQARYGIEVRQELCVEPDIDLESKDALYRIAQEALHNVVKHANAKTILIRLAFADASISLQIMDDGKGFTAESVPPGRMGLLSISERAFKLGGALDIETAPGEGTKIHVLIPVRQ